MSRQETFQPRRRDFGKMALGGALGALLAPQKSKTAVHPNAPGIKLCAQSSATPTDDQLLFLKQIGADYVSVGAPPDMRTAESFLAIQKRYADAGIMVWNIGNTSVHNMPEVTLNLPGRDRKIEEYKQYIRNLGKAGIYYTTYAHMGNGIWSSGRAMVRGAGVPRIFLLGAAGGQEEKGLGASGSGPARTLTQNVLLGSRVVPQKVNFLGQGNKGGSSRLPLGEERANILLLACCYQEGWPYHTRLCGYVYVILKKPNDFM